MVNPCSFATAEREFIMAKQAATHRSAGAYRKKRKTTAKLDVRRDSMDFRDLTYSASLAPLPDELYPAWRHLSILDQGRQGACTGFGLAAVINYLRATRGQAEQVSPAMLFAMAKRYDQWPGENYDHSSNRGAMKGWHKHGACSEALWPLSYTEGLTPTIQLQAQEVPLGAYFRVFSRINDVQAALRDVGMLFASAATHSGWDAPQDGAIAWDPEEPAGDGHAFAIVGYNRDGFLIQNSWGLDWGGYAHADGVQPGVALWRYADFEANIWDVWVAQLGVPLSYIATDTACRYVENGGVARLVSVGPPQEAIYLHYLHIDDGRFDALGEYASEPAQLEAILRELDTLKPKHLLLYAHGGLNNVSSAAMRAFKWRPVWADNGIYELHFIWETGLLAELGDLLKSKLGEAERRVGAASSWWDNKLEQLAQPLGHALWQEMKLDAERAFVQTGAGTQALIRLLDWLVKQGPDAPRVHLVGHSAGAIWQARLLEAWQILNGPALDNLLLLAPACTFELHDRVFLPLLGNLIRQQHLFVLSDDDEQDDNVARIYRKSLLYMVSNSFDDKQKKTPLLGMARFHTGPQPPASTLYIAGRNSAWSGSASHGGFDNDAATMNSLLQLILGMPAVRRFKEEELKGY